MANAWCINAYDCNGCLIQTLQNLDSACIGVGVQYTAPNPLDDKRLDYIKYTDKCWCVQCLSAENEILIYATNGVIKNLTLTNDDVNEAIKIKWNDIFWSNRAKTIVRYKTGSAPVSITDGTLAVEETTKNQYSSTPFSLSGVLDETTYYISAFAVDSNGTIINVQGMSIKTDFTFAWYQKVEYLKSDWNQHIDTWINYNNCPTPIVEYRFRNNNSTGCWMFWFWAPSPNKWYIFWIDHNQFKFISQSAWTGYTWITYSTWWHTFTTTSTQWKVDWTVWYSHSTTMWASWFNVYLFRTNNFWAVPTDIDVSYCKISKPDWTVLREFIPCFRKSDWVAWMLDIVNRVFYTNAWTWTFTKWPDIN